MVPKGGLDLHGFPHHRLKMPVVCTGFAVRADIVPTREFISSSTRFPFLIKLDSHEGNDKYYVLSFDKPFREKGGEMAKTVSDNLIVRIIQKGEEKVFDLRKTFNENPNRVISTVGTVNEDGWPNTAPMSLFFCPDEETIVAGMVRSSQTATNIRRDGRVIIEMVFGGDVVFGIRGKGTVQKEALECSETTMAFKIDVVSVKRDTSPAQIVTSGPSCTPRSDRAVEYEKAVWKELIEIAST